MSNYKTKVYSDGHFIYSDEPEELGGTNEGMAPGALLLASLGSCTAITIRMYADRKGLNLEFIRIELAICKKKDMNEATVITRKIELTGALTGEQHDRLMQIADKCPIHKILTNPIKIETKG
jgi:putative redox protein